MTGKSRENDKLLVNKQIISRQFFFKFKLYTVRTDQQWFKGRFKLPVLKCI